MRLRSLHQETRFVLAGMLSALVAAGVLGAWWHSPWSPVALDRASALLAAGHAQQALDAYRSLADGWASDAVREQASWRAAQVAAVELDDPDVGARMLEAYLWTWPAGEHRVDARILLAATYQARLNSPAAAAEVWVAAADESPTHANAGTWLLAAGKGFATAGLPSRATVPLERATLYPSVASSAWMALARLSLATDPDAAYIAYTHALDTATGAQAQLARLGAATALERLERRDEALAELDYAVQNGVADRALLRRRTRLRATP